MYIIIHMHTYIKNINFQKISAKAKTKKNKTQNQIQTINK